MVVVWSQWWSLVIRVPPILVWTVMVAMAVVVVFGMVPMAICVGALVVRYVMVAVVMVVLRRWWSVSSWCLWR